MKNTPKKTTKKEIEPTTKGLKKKPMSASAKKSIAKSVSEKVNVISKRRPAITMASHYDLRRDVAWNYYIDPNSPTWNNAFQSAVKAGYTAGTAKSIGGENWWRQRLENFITMLPLAEKNLIEDLELATTETYYKGDGEDAVELTFVNPKLRKLRQDASIFIAETVGKKTYSKKLELENNVKVSLVEGNSLIDKLFE